MVRGCVLVIFLLACGSGKRREQTHSPPKDAAVTTRPSVNLSVHRFDSPPVKLPNQLAFALLDPGKGTQEPLRYRQARGTASYTIETRLTSRRLVNRAWGEPQALPPIKNGLRVTIEEPGRPLLGEPLAGEIVGKATPEAEQYLASWNAIAGRKLSIVIDERGRLGEIAFQDDPATKTSGATIDELVQRFLAIVVPVPDQPVGIGAQWRVVTALRQRPAIVKQTATYTLVARTPTQWKVRVDIARVAEVQTLLEPGLPPDTVLELQALRRSFSGVVTIEPDKPLPRGSLDVSSSIHLRMLSKTGQRGEEIVEDSGTVMLSPMSPPRR